MTEPGPRCGDNISESFQKRELMEKIQDQLEFLLSAALRKCGNLQDAEDLTQETILAALLREKEADSCAFKECSPAKAVSALRPCHAYDYASSRHAKGTYPR